jgi:hypothetical protein
MNKIILLLLSTIPVLSQRVFPQDCKTNADLDATPGKYLTAAEYPWPAVRAEYFANMATTKDKAMAKQIAGQIEKAEQQSHAGFKLTGGNWENIYSTKGYGYLGNTRLGQYRFESSLHEFFCLNGKLKRNDEAGTILRIYVNDIPANTLDRFLHLPFGSSMGDYDFGFQYLDWKNHKPADVNAPLIGLFTYLSCNNEQLLKAINSGEGYFQDVPEKDIKPNNRSNYIYRYWFVTKKDIPVLLPVSRKEYLQSLLEYYEREKLYFPKLVSKLTQDHDKGVKQYSNWESDVADKIAAVKKALNDHDTNWLSAQAVINRSEDDSQNYKAGLKERTNNKRFWKFYDTQSKSEPLYQYNPEYFKNTVQGPAKPQVITIAFRYVSMPLSLRILDNYTKNFDFTALKKMLD